MSNEGDSSKKKKDEVTNETYQSPKFVVGVGSSAGGIEALTTMFSNMPEPSENAFVIVQHMSPDFKTMLPEILSRQCSINIEVATEGAPLKAGSIYLIPPTKLMRTYNGRLLLEERTSSHPSSFFPIDYFFESLAKDFGPQSIGVILSGTGSDGSKGTVFIKQNSGYNIIQSPDSAKFSGMPKNALKAGAGHCIKNVTEIMSQVEEHSAGIRTPNEKKGTISVDRTGTSLDKVF